MKRILSWIFQLVFFLIATFLFVVLYDHGPAGFIGGAKQEFGELVAWVGGSQSGKIPPSN